MGYLHEKAGIVLRLGLLSLLLAAQSLLIAHELDHFSAGDTSLCAVCSISSGTDSPVHVEQLPPDSMPVSPNERTRPHTVSIKVITTPLTARAPPSPS